MKTMNNLIMLLTFSILSPAITTAQGEQPFSEPAYRDFLERTQNLTAEGLLTLHDAGIFQRAVDASYSTAEYFDSINAHYNFTPYELQLLGQHGFVVTERLSRESFGDALIDIYKADLPVFVSTDAILHAIHRSYDKILQTVEVYFLYNKIDTLLRQFHGRVNDLGEKYSHLPAMRASLRDVDVYLTVALKLLDPEVHPVFIDNAAEVDRLLDLIDAEQMATYPLFSGTERYVDFSQFTVRGHYTSENFPQLARYFRSMMWLGRTEMYLIAPANITPAQSEAEIQRQAIDAVLISELAELDGGEERIAEIDNIIRFFVGESDNVTLPNINMLTEAVGIDSASDLLDLTTFMAFQDTLRKRSYAIQRINSQILMSDGVSPDGIEPAASFLLLGQRFVIDSYTTGAVVYDKIRYQGAKVPRMLPKTLDILFALGNDAAVQLLKDELEQYHYSPNLAAVRYLVDSYEPEFWRSTFYNAWLNAIRQLGPPAERSALPAFMRTASWWQEKMNTQLASWSQLRHDNLLYAKQSYSGGIVCSFPESYVEPIPSFYRAVKSYAELGAAKFSEDRFSGFQIDMIVGYFEHLRGVADTLGAISEKELMHTPLDAAEKSFLRTMLRCVFICGLEYDGWYPRLFYQDHENAMRAEDFTVADVHTAPTDPAGNIVGWVLHGGTGPVNLGAWIAEKPDGGACAYVGPVMSYYEHVSTNFRRLTDETWETLYSQPPSFRPDFVNLYLAGDSGNSLGEGHTLLTGFQEPGNGSFPARPVLMQNYPNPFNPSTIIAYTIPPEYENEDVTLKVFDLLGRTVATLVSANLPEGNYVSRWDGINNRNLPAPSGVYVYKLRVGSFVEIRKLILVR